MPILAITISGKMNSKEPNFSDLNHTLSKEDFERLYGKWENVVQYMDYTNGQPDNGHYIPNLVPRMLQPLEDLSDSGDKFLSTVDIEALVKQAEQSTGGLPQQIIPDQTMAPLEKDLNRFGSVTSDDKLKEAMNCSFSTVTKCKALWAARIFDQWKCIRNYKLKADSSLTYPEIKGTLVNMDLEVMYETLCLFVLEIRKQNGDEYPRNLVFVCTGNQKTEWR